MSLSDRARAEWYLSLSSAVVLSTCRTFLLKRRVRMLPTLLPIGSIGEGGSIFTSQHLRQLLLLLLKLLFK